MELPGLHRVSKIDKSGCVTVYYYAWRGGPALTKFGSPDGETFRRAYKRAHALRRGTLIEEQAATPMSVNNLDDLCTSFSVHPDVTRLSAATRSNYYYHLRLIRKHFGSMSLDDLQARGTRTMFLDWRDRIGVGSPAYADAIWRTLSRLCSWGVHRELLLRNPFCRGGRISHSNRRELIWDEDRERRVLCVAPKHLAIPFLLALWTGQRLNDLLKIKWEAYDGTYLRFQQSKTGARVCIKVQSDLKAMLDAEMTARQAHLLFEAARTGDQTSLSGCEILRTTKDTAWTASGFQASWQRLKRISGVRDRTFHDLRGTAVTRLYISGATEAEIVSVTGHTMRDVSDMLDKHYAHRDVKLSNAGMEKLFKTYRLIPAAQL